MSAWHFLGALLAAFFVLMVLLAWPLARWIDRVMAGRFNAGRRIEAPLYRLAGVDAEAETPWQRYAIGLLVFNGLGVVVVCALQRLQLLLPLNPQGMAAVSVDSAFNTAVSFVTNTNWQGYGGEATMSYPTQSIAMGPVASQLAIKMLGILLIPARMASARSCTPCLRPATTTAAPLPACRPTRRSATCCWRW